ncbi:MAG TPA: Gfo/Idh/MocA family oxidoreductase, partial [Bryobacteraceae bacterium]|nr:Gfo/Idh/MocA family oxidoreductase [Bryobacteraceae bacterium]
RHAPECDRMVEAFARAALPLFVAYYRRCLPRFLEVRRIIAADGIGQVTGVRYAAAAAKHTEAAAWRVDAARAGGGHFLDVGSHVLDLLDFLFGPLQAVAGSAAHSGGPTAVEDLVALAFTTGSGVPGAASWNFAAAVPEDRLVISGMAGQLSLSVFGADPILWETKAGISQIDKPHPPHVAQPLIQAVVDDLLGLTPCPSTGESARRTSRVMDAVLDTYYGGRSDKFWARPETWPGRKTTG